MLRVSIASLFVLALSFGCANKTDTKTQCSLDGKKPACAVVKKDCEPGCEKACCTTEKAKEKKELECGL